MQHGGLESGLIASQRKGLLACFSGNLLMISQYSMKNQPALDISVEEVSLLLEELGISSGLFYRSLFPVISALRSGRSPRAIGMEEQLRTSQDYLSSLRQVFMEMEKSLSQLRNTFSAMKDQVAQKQIFSELDQEVAFYDQFQKASEVILQKLTLIAQEDRLSPLGRAPIEEAWAQVEKLALEI